jgi:hypothetical protein
MLRSLPSIAIALLWLPLELSLADSRHAVGKFIVHVEKHEFVHSHPRLRPRIPQDPNISIICSSFCSDLNSAAATCLGDSCFCAVLSASGSTCSECFADVNVTVAADLGSAFAICATEFPDGIDITTAAPVITGDPTSVEELAEECTTECSLLNSALVTCADDLCFCPTALSVGSACSNCLMTVNATQGTNLGSAISVCQTEFGSGDTVSTTPNISALPFILGSQTATVTVSATDVSDSDSKSSDSAGKGGLPVGAIVGIIVGVVAALAIGAIAMFFLLRRPSARPQGTSTNQFPPYQPPRTGAAASDADTEKSGAESQTGLLQEEIPSAAIKYLDPDETVAQEAFPSGPAWQGEPTGARTNGNY